MLLIKFLFNEYKSAYKDCNVIVKLIIFSTIIISSIFYIEPSSANNWVIMKSGNSSDNSCRLYLENSNKIYNVEDSRYPIIYLTFRGLNPLKTEFSITTGKIEHKTLNAFILVNGRKFDILFKEKWGWLAKANYESDLYEEIIISKEISFHTYAGNSEKIYYFSVGNLNHSFLKLKEECRFAV